MEQLKNILLKIGGFSDEEIELTLTNVEAKQYQKGTILVKEGQISNTIYFIAEGFLRTYQLVDGKDKTISFGKPDQFIASLSGLNSSSPSEENIETITAATIMSLDAEKLEYLKHKIPRISFLMNILFKEILECKEQRIKDFINRNSTERYKLFVTNNPGLIKVVSINHLSSFLGVAPETISRIRNKIIF